METSVHLTRQAPRYIVYGNNLRYKENAYLEIQPGVMALLDYHDNGKLKKKYVIVENKYCQTSLQIFPVCSCGVDNCLHIKEFTSISGPPEN